ncbi:hypothetical protein M569_00072 [Genlisea aurea]|uniref:Uncharacterized protein n=1 Tax=Genlisea aurea TaxID=192259 RepID=S8EP70_9LAMI|nr:hypothetical protein M569_00072 [Genlisea aurea]
MLDILYDALAQTIVLEVPDRGFFLGLTFALNGGFERVRVRTILQLSSGWTIFGLEIAGRLFPGFEARPKLLAAATGPYHPFLPLSWSLWGVARAKASVTSYGNGIRGSLYGIPIRLVFLKSERNEISATAGLYLPFDMGLNPQANKELIF